MNLSTALLAVTLFMASSCQLQVDKNKKTGSIRNDIVVNATGLKVEQAFLLFEDGKLVPPDNKVEVNQKVILRLIVTGWKEKEGKVYVSGGEKLETSDGQVILNEPELFGGYDAGLAAEDAKYISLNVVITAVDKLYDYYKVSFSLKDKLAPQNHAEGYYKIFLK